ncbi:hypothetical protein H8683_07930, partial [Helicobacter pylori]|uniref:hypothetical protein n=1 Tax=Helicobacter pylori TaxID=210 RepID=UPI001A9C1046
PNLEVKLFIADNTALFKSGNVGRCRDREMFFSLAFLFNFIIDSLFCLFRGYLVFYAKVSQFLEMRGMGN